MRHLVVLLCLVLASGACKKRGSAIAKLTRTEGPVERQADAGAWKPVSVGAEYFLGDAARTADGAAQLEIAGGALIAMQPHTILRFGGTTEASKIAVELGAIDLTGTGSYGFDLGDVKLSRNGTVRISAGATGSTVELTIGEAQVSTAGGQTIDLVIGEVFDIGLDVAVTTVIDAGTADAAVVDAAVPVIDDANVAAIEVTGKKAEVQLAGETTWTSLEAGAGNLPKGAKLRLGAGTSAKLTSRGTTLDLGGGSRVGIGANLELVIEAGDVRASASSATSVTLPGGALALGGSEAAPAEAKLGVGARETRVTMTRGGARLTGSPGSELALSRGETATLGKAGTIRVIEAIPNYFDFRLAVGETLTIHDPRPPTAVQFQFGGKCPSGGIVELDRDGRFKTAKVSAGKETANLLVGNGGWTYRLRCTSAGGEGSGVASGRIIVKRDDGRRKLPKLPPSNTIDADGRTWRISYQSQIPNLQVHSRGTGRSFKLHLAQGGKAETFDSQKPSILVKGSTLREGEYAYWFEIDGKKQPKVSTLKIDFDQTAPQVYIEAPANAKPWSGDIDVRGAVLPGWTAAVEGITIPIDSARRFAAKVSQPPGNALAIRLSHPQRGIHYYLRRAR